MKHLTCGRTLRYGICILTFTLSHPCKPLAPAEQDVSAAARDLVDLQPPPPPPHPPSPATRTACDSHDPNFTAFLPPPRAEQDVTAAARDLVELVKHLTVVARDPRSAIFVMELFRGSPTARNKAAVRDAIIMTLTATSGRYIVARLSGQRSPAR